MHHLPHSCTTSFCSLQREHTLQLLTSHSHKGMPASLLHGGSQAYCMRAMQVP